MRGVKVAAGGDVPTGFFEMIPRDAQRKRFKIHITVRRMTQGAGGEKLLSTILKAILVTSNDLAKQLKYGLHYRFSKPTIMLLALVQSKVLRTSAK